MDRWFYDLFPIFPSIPSIFRSIYLEREAATASEERKKSLHLVNPVEITLEEVFEGAKSPREIAFYQSGSRDRVEERTVVSDFFLEIFIVNYGELA